MIYYLHYHADCIGRIPINVENQRGEEGGGGGGAFFWIWGGGGGGGGVPFDQSRAEVSSSKSYFAQK